MLPELLSDIQKCLPFVILKFSYEILFLLLKILNFSNDGHTPHELTGIIFIVSGVTRVRNDIIRMI